MENFSYQMFFEIPRDLMSIAPDGIRGKIAIMNNNPAKG